MLCKLWFLMRILFILFALFIAGGMGKIIYDIIFNEYGNMVDRIVYMIAAIIMIIADGFLIFILWNIKACM